jgi:hypothetical protein
LNLKLSSADIELNCAITIMETTIFPLIIDQASTNLSTFHIPCQPQQSLTFSQTRNRNNASQPQKRNTNHRPRTTRTTLFRANPRPRLPANHAPRIARGRSRQPRRAAIRRRPAERLREAIERSTTQAHRASSHLLPLSLSATPPIPEEEMEMKKVLCAALVAAASATAVMASTEAPVGAPEGAAGPSASGASAPSAPAAAALLFSALAYYLH